MENGFNKFKKKIMLEVLINSIIFGFSLGLATFAIPFLYIKINKIDFNIIYLILIGLVMSLLMFTICYLIIKPSKKKIAIRVDRELNLNEKVQTMVEYENKDGFIVKVQREDTLSILSNTSIKTLSMKISVFLIVLLILACSVCVTALAIPSENEGSGEIPEIEDPDYDVDDWTLKALHDLIEYVEKAEFDGGLKTLYLDKLNALLNEVKDYEKFSEMVDSVTKVIYFVEVELDKLNTSNEIYKVLIESESLQVDLLAGQIYFLNPEKVKLALEGFIILINGNKDAIVELANNKFASLLTESSIDNNDPLYKTVLDFANEIDKCRDREDVNNSVINVVNKSIDPIVSSVIDQKANSDVCEYIVDALISIFGLEEILEDEFGSNSSDGKEDEEDEDIKLPTTGQGGLGTGELEVGSDDLIFDIEEGIVKYGEVIERYYGDIIGKLQEGTISEELRTYFNKYFDELFGDIQADDESLGE